MEGLWIFVSVTLFLGWMTFCLIASMVIRRLPGMSRVLMSLVMVAINAAVIGVSGYVMTEYVFNKGPDDWGAMWHASYPLAAKYGTASHSSYRVLAFDKDPDGRGSGTYRIRFGRDEHRGLILCHYEMVTRSFDRDEIQEKP